MFERFTDGARNVLIKSEELARQYRSPMLRRHHLLIALTDDAVERPDAIPAKILKDAGVDLAALRDALVASLTTSEESAPGAVQELRYTVESKKTLELALREALSLGHNYIGCEHLLLSILRTADGPLATAIAATELRYGSAREYLRTSIPSGKIRREVRRAVRFQRGQRTTDAVDDAIETAYRRALNERPVTTGDLLVALAEGKGTHFSKVMGAFPLPNPTELAAAVDALIADQSADGEPDPVRVDPRTGAFTVADPDLAAKVKAMSPDKIAEALRRLIDEE